MLFAINGNTDNIREITLKSWSDESFWGPDCFGDLETSFQDSHDFLAGTFAYVCTEKEYQDLVEWWEEEIRCMNAREFGQNGDDYTELCGDELVLCAD